MGFKKGYTPWNKGKQSSRKGISLELEYGIEKAKQIKEKLRNSHKGQKAWNRGIPCREETKKRLSLANKGQIPWCKGKKTGLIPWNKGKKTGIKPWLGKKRPNMTGEHNYNWKGGYVKRRRGCEWQIIREEILIKYRFKCVHCGKTEDLVVHHIIPYRKKQEHKIENLIPLCRSCHTTEEHKTQKLNGGGLKLV